MRYPYGAVTAYLCSHLLNIPTFVYADHAITLLRIHPVILLCINISGVRDLFYRKGIIIVARRTSVKKNIYFKTGFARRFFPCQELFLIGNFDVWTGIEKIVSTVTRKGIKQKLNNPNLKYTITEPIIEAINFRIPALLCQNSCVGKKRLSKTFL